MKLHIERLEICVKEVELNPRFNRNPIRLINAVCLKTNVGCIDFKFTKSSDVRISDVSIGGEVTLSRKDEIPVIDLRFSTSARCQFGYGMNVLVDLQWIKKPRLNFNKLCYPLVDLMNALHQLQYIRNKKNQRLGY